MALVAALVLGAAGVARGQQAGPRAANLFANAGFEADPGGGPASPVISGWNAYLWSGSGEIRLTDAAVEGRHAVRVTGLGPAKQAIFQEFKLAPCSYRLGASVATRGLAPNADKQAGTLVLNFEGRSSIVAELGRGDMDWHRLALQFQVDKPTKLLAYFFNYGSGSLFVDDVVMTPAADCTMAGETAATLTPLGQPLTYRPPLAPDDLVLRGLCGDPGFAKRAPCRPLDPAEVAALRPPRASGTVMLDDFEGKGPFSAPAIAPPTRTISGKASALLVPGRYLAATFAAGATGQKSAGDWSGQDWLRLDVDNASAAPQPLYVEIWDDKTQGYWSRLNWYTVAPPGRSVVEVPLNGFVGEKSVVRERRRLDLANIRRLILTAQKAELVVDDIRLEPAAGYATDFPELVKFDFGPPTSPVFYGFTRFGQAAVYSADRGYGLSRDAVIGREEDRRHPDSLLGDWISFKSGGIDVDLPNGDYRVWMMLEDAGYWEHYPSHAMRKVLVQGRPVLDEKRSAADFFARFYRHAGSEDLPGDDIWSRYIKARYQPLEATAAVRDGQLRIRFDSDGDPLAVPLSAMILYPEGKAVQGTAFLEELWTRLHATFDREYQQVRPPVPAHAKPPGNALDGKLMVFQRSAAANIFAGDWPDARELTGRIDVKLARGQYEAVQIGLHAIEPVELTDVRVQLDGLTVEAYKVRHKVTRLTQDGNVYWNIPSLLDPLDAAPAKPVPLPIGRSVTLWFDIHAPPAMAPGIRQGLLTLTFADGSRHDIPISATIAPWTLPEADVPIGYLGVGPVYPSTRYPEVEAKRVREFALSIALLRRFGMTAVTGGMGGPRLLGYANGQPQMDFQKAGLVMALLRPHFQREINGYAGMDLDGLPAFTAFDAPTAFGKPYGVVLKDVLDATAEQAKGAGWPEILHVVGDEPGDASIPGAVGYAKALKSARPGTRSTVFTSLRDPAKDAASAFAGPVDRVYLTLHSEAALRHVVRAGSECGLYNQSSRYRRGVYLFKMRELKCAGHLQFAFHSAHADQWYDLDGREGDQVAVFTHPDGSLRLALEFLRYRQAITDYRTLLALEQAIAKAPAGAPKTAAARWLRDLEAAMAVGSDKPAAWTDAGLDDVRAAAVDHIAALGWGK